jgi:hypothetical protein
MSDLDQLQTRLAAASASVPRFGGDLRAIGMMLAVLPNVQAGPAELKELLEKNRRLVDGWGARIGNDNEAIVVLREMLSIVDGRLSGVGDGGPQEP